MPVVCVIILLAMLGFMGFLAYDVIDLFGFMNRRGSAGRLWDGVRSRILRVIAFLVQMTHFMSVDE